MALQMPENKELGLNLSIISWVTVGPDEVGH